MTAKLASSITVARKSVCRVSGFLVLLLSYAAVFAGEPQNAPVPLDRFPRDTVTIATPDARVHRFNVWVAANVLHREQGLMFVKSLPDDAGMWFIYPSPWPAGIWMKNTYIPLDILFVEADGRVAYVATGKPHSLDTISPGKDVLAVLELKAGTAARLGIRAGAIVSAPGLPGNR
jgi:uncharacterized protein